MYIRCILALLLLLVRSGWSLPDQPARTSQCVGAIERLAAPLSQCNNVSVHCLRLRSVSGSASALPGSAA